MIARFTRKGEQSRIFHNADIFEGYLVTFSSEGKYTPLWDSSKMSPKDRDAARPIKDVRVAIKKGLAKFLIKVEGTDAYTVEDITLEKVREKKDFDNLMKSLNEGE